MNNERPQKYTLTHAQFPLLRMGTYSDNMVPKTWFNLVPERSWHQDAH